MTIILTCSLVFGILFLTSWLIDLQLPETKGKKLPDSVKEMVKSLDTKHGKRGDVEERVLLTDDSDSEDNLA